MNLLKKCLPIVIAILIIAGGLWATVKIIKIRIAISKANAEEIVPERDDLDRLLDRLADCESGNNEKAIHQHDPITPSFGLVQFKTDTFYRYNKKYQILPDLEKAEVANVIFDGNVQRRLAKAMLEDDYSNWLNWKNCLKPYFE